MVASLVVSSWTALAAVQDRLTAAVSKTSLRLGTGIRTAECSRELSSSVVLSCFLALPARPQPLVLYLFLYFLAHSLQSKVMYSLQRFRCMPLWGSRQDTKSLRPAILSTPELDRHN